MCNILLQECEKLLELVPITAMRSMAEYEVNRTYNGNYMVCLLFFFLSNPVHGLLYLYFDKVSVYFL